MMGWVCNDGGRVMGGCVMRGGYVMRGCVESVLPSHSESNKTT